MSLLKEFAIQLYSLKNETAQDFLGVLKKLSEIGYTKVEFAGYGNIDAKTMKKALDEYKIQSMGSHVGIERLRENFEFEVEYNKTIGTKYIVVPAYPMKTRDDALKAAEEMNLYTEKLNKEGFVVGYHNHEFEFVKADDEYLLDILFKNTKNLCMELDLYWVSYAGVDALDYLFKNKEITKLLHLKQIKDFETKNCVDLNEGVLDFKEIITKALSYGVEEFILEQEEFAVSPYVSVKNGFDHIMSL